MPQLGRSLADAFVHAAQANINVLQGKVAELLRQSEKLGEEGDVDGSQAAAAQVETLKVDACS